MEERNVMCEFCIFYGFLPEGKLQSVLSRTAKTQKHAVLLVRRTRGKHSVTLAAVNWQVWRWGGRGGGMRGHLRKEKATSELTI